jgi:shikimate dehydrogenase
LVGEATDGLAMVSAIHKAGLDPAGKTAHIIGAGGGAGLAIIDCLCENGIAGLVVEEINPARREALFKLLREHWPDVKILQGIRADILVNATTLGKSADDALPFDESTIASASLCCDVITNADDTSFIRAARRAGKSVVDGNEMGAEQIAVQLGFVGVAP